MSVIAFPTKNRKGPSARFCTVTIADRKETAAVVDFLLPEELKFLSQDSLAEIFNSPPQTHTVVLLVHAGTGGGAYHVVYPSLPADDNENIARVNEFSKLIGGHNFKLN